MLNVPLDRPNTRPTASVTFIGIAGRMRRDHAERTSEDQLIEHMKVACAASAMRRALTIGQLVIDGLYDGDFALWHEKRAKWRPYRQLSKRADLPLSAADMYRCTAIYVLSAQMNAAQRWPDLSISHLRQVVGLADAVQVEALDNAQAQRWSVTQLANAVKHVRLTAPEQRGRPPLHPMQKALQRMARVVDETFAQEYQGKSLAGLDRDDLRQLLQMTQRVTEFCQSVSAQLEGSSR